MASKPTIHITLTGDLSVMNFNLKNLFSYTGAALAALYAAISLNAQMVPTGTIEPTGTYNWIGNVDSNYLNAANWRLLVGGVETGVATVAPGQGDDIRLLQSSTTRVLDIINTDAGNKQVDVFGMSSAVSYGYTLNLSTQTSGTLIYNITGRGTHPFNASAQTNSAGEGAMRLRFNINMGRDTVLRFDQNGGWGNSGTGNPVVTDQTAGLIYAFVTMEGNAVLDARDARNPLTITGTNSTSTTNPPGSVNSQGTLAIGGLNMSKDAVVYLNYGKSNLGDAVLANMEENWAGLVIKEDWTLADFNVDLTRSGSLPEDVTMDMLSKNANMQDTQKWGVGITRVSGTVFHPGGVVNIRSSAVANRNGYAVDGLHVGPINGTNNSTWIGGKGHIQGLVTVQKGSLITGGDRGTAGTLTVTGTIDISRGTSADPAGGSLSIDLMTATEFDKVIINGNFIISSTSGVGFLTVGRGEEFPLTAGTFRVLEVNDGDILGAFPDNNVTLPQSLGLAASYLLGSRSLDIIFTQLDFGDNPDIMGNYHTMAMLIDKAAAAGAVSNSLFDTLNRQPSIAYFRQVIDQLTPIIYQAWFPSAVVRVNSMVQSVEDRLMQDAGYGRSPRSVQTYVQGWRQESSRTRDVLAAYSNYDTYATMAGVDYAFSENTVAGVYLAYETTEYDFDAYGSTGEGKGYTIGAYARHNFGNWQFNAVTLFGTDDYSASRNISLTRLGTWANADTDGSRLGAGVSVAYTFKHPWVEASPVLGVQWLNWKADAFTETGFEEENVNLAVKSQSETSLQTRLGVRLSRAFESSRGFIRPYLHMAYVREFESDERDMTADVLGVPFTIKAPGIDANGMRVDAGIDWDVTRAVRAGVRYTAQYNNACDESMGVRAIISFAF
jgi:uncharacterized protein with beta-barrel porin domain